MAHDLWTSARDAPIGTVVAHDDGRIIFANACAATMLEYDEADLRSRNIRDLLDLRSPGPELTERRLASGRGRRLWIAVALGVADDHIVVHMTDVTVQRAEVALHREVIGAMAQNASIEAVMTAVCTEVQKLVPRIVATVLALDDDGTVRPLAAPALPPAVAAAFAGLPIGPLAGSCGTAMHRGERVIVTDIANDPLWASYRHVVLPLGLRACWSTPITSTEGRVLGAFAFYDREPVGPDPTQLQLIDLCVDLCAVALERDRAARWMHQLTVFDALTGLPNRRTIHEAGDRSVAAASRAHEPLTTLVVDVDRFQEINDSHGRAAADDVLQEVASRLRSAIRGEDLLGRLGNDEFVAILPGAMAADGVQLAQRIADRLAAPIDVAGDALTVGVSAGVSEHPDHGRDIETLIRNAELALRHAKTSGRGLVRVFHSEMNTEMARRRSVERALRRGLERDGFVLHYQPQVWAEEPGGLYGLESLLRLRDEELGFLRPDAFLGVAEECQLMPELNRHVLEVTLAQLAAWDVTGPHVPQIALNMSASSFRGPALAWEVADALTRHDLAPDRLMIEVTESVMLDESDRVRANFAQLHEMGVRLSLDDFGTGYSSLSYLHRLRVDELKLDRSFVHEIDGHTNASTLINSVLGIAERLQLTVVAEGVEKPVQRDFLTERRCDVLQGYLLARPMAAERIPVWIAARLAV